MRVIIRGWGCGGERGGEVEGEGEAIRRWIVVKERERVRGVARVEVRRGCGGGEREREREPRFPRLVGHLSKGLLNEGGKTCLGPWILECRYRLL